MMGNTIMKTIPDSEISKIVGKVKKARDEEDSGTFNKEFSKLVPKKTHIDGSLTINLNDILNTMYKHQIIRKGGKDYGNNES